MGQADMGDKAEPANAAEWLIALREEPQDAALRARFACWLAASPAHQGAWAETVRTYELIGPALQPQATPEQVLAPPPRTARRSYRSVGLAAAACLAFVLLPDLCLRFTADYVTRTDEQRVVALPDGSLAALGPDSAIRIDNMPGLRQVRLLSGEAFFEVKHDPARPFTVLAGPVRTTDIGTSFDIQHGPAGIMVSVASGAVRVEAPGMDAARLQAGQWVRLGKQGHPALGTMPVDQVAAWREGRLIVNDRPVSEVVDELRPYITGMIILADHGAKTRRVTGVYDLRDPMGALRAVQQAHPAMRLHQISPWLLIITGS